MNTSTNVTSVRERALDLSRNLEWLGPLVARITLGIAFVVSGWGKVHSLDKVTGFFMKLGIPAPGFNAHLVSFVELICGALLLVGLATRLAALPLIATMIVAIITAQREELAVFSDLFGLVEWTYIALLVWLVLAGPGKASVDQLLTARNSQQRVGSLAV